MEFKEGFDAEAMHKDLLSAIKSCNKAQKIYLLLDEVQEVQTWEKCINSLFENQNVDIYVTGSNSKLLSSEISTYLTGRFVLIPVYTLSFTEFIEFKKTFVSTLQNESDEAYFDLYLKSGGFPFIAKTNHTQKKYYLLDISFKYNQLGYSPKTVASVLENLVYLELRRRGYSIYIAQMSSFYKGDVKFILSC